MNYKEKYNKLIFKAKSENRIKGTNINDERFNNPDWQRGQKWKSGGTF